MIKAVDQIELKSENGINQDILDRKIDFATAKFTENILTGIRFKELSF
jgi:hypothetical protein